MNAFTALWKCKVYWGRRTGIIRRQPPTPPKTPFPLQLLSTPCLRCHPEELSGLAMSKTSPPSETPRKDRPVHPWSHYAAVLLPSMSLLLYIPSMLYNSVYVTPFFSCKTMHHSPFTKKKKYLGTDSATDRVIY